MNLMLRLVFTAVCIAKPTLFNLYNGNYILQSDGMKAKSVSYLLLPGNFHVLNEI